MSQKKKASPNTIAVNRKARHDYLLEGNFEAGLMLQGWEVKSIRAGKVQISESHVIVRKGEAYLLNAHISPTKGVCTHFVPDESRTRKLLMHRREIDKLIGHIQQKGYTVVPLSLYWKNGRVKVEVALAKGKKTHDKRASEKDRDWARQKERIMKKNQSS